MQDKTVLLLVLVFLLVGCGGAYKASKVNRIPLEETETVIYQDFWLKTNVGIMTVGAQNQNGLLKPRVRLKNLTNKQVDAEIRVKFLDRQGFELDDDMGWDPLPLEPGEIATYSKTALSKEARKYKFILKLANN